MKIKLYVIVIFYFLSGSTLAAQEIIPFEQSSLWGYKGKDGSEIIEPQYQHAGEFVDKFAITLKNYLFGVINIENKTIIPFKYDIIIHLRKGRFIVGNKSKYFREYDLGVITYENQIIIKPEYRNISSEKGFYKVSLQQDSIIGKMGDGDVRSVRTKYGLFDTAGNETIPCIFNYIRWSTDSLVVLSRGNSQALFLPNGKQLTDFKYIVIDDYHEGLLKVREGNKYGYIDKEGEIVIPIQFEMGYSFSGGFAIIQKGEKWGAIDPKGRMVIQPMFTYQEVKDKLEKKIR